MSALAERDLLLERLDHLRGVLPVFAEELAIARRRAARLLAENERLERELQCLRREHGAAGPALTPRTKPRLRPDARVAEPESAR